MSRRIDRARVNAANPGLDRRRKRTPEMDAEIREAATTGLSIRALSRAFGLDRKTIKVINDEEMEDVLIHRRLMGESK